MGNSNCKNNGRKYAPIDKKETVETEAAFMSFATRIPNWSLHSLRRHVARTTSQRDSTTTVDSGTQGSIMSGDKQYNGHRKSGDTIPSSPCSPFLKQLRESPYSFRGDYEQMMTRIIRHRSEFPLKIWEAIIVAARAPDSNPVTFYWEVYEAVRTMILVGSDGNNDRHSDCTLEEVEVALRVFPNILREHHQLRLDQEEQQQQQQGEGQRKRKRRFRRPFRGNKSRPFDSLLIELEEEFRIRLEAEDDIEEEEEEGVEESASMSCNRSIRKDGYHKCTHPALLLFQLQRGGLPCQRRAVVEDDIEEEEEVEKPTSMSCNTSIRKYSYHKCTHKTTTTTGIEENHDDTEKTCSMRTASTRTSSLVGTDDFVNQCATAHRSKLSWILQELLQEPGDDLTALLHLRERGLLRRKCVGDCLEVALTQPPSSRMDCRFRFLLACYPEILPKRKLFRKFLLHCYNCHGEDCRATDGQWLRLKSLLEIGLWHFPHQMGFVVQGNRVVQFVDFSPYLRVSCFLFGRTNVTRLVRRILWKFAGGWGGDGLHSMLVVRWGMLRNRWNAAFPRIRLGSSFGTGESSQGMGIDRCTEQDWGRGRDE